MLTSIYNYLCCNMITIIIAMLMIGILYYAWSIIKRIMNKFKKSNGEIKDILKNKLVLKDNENKNAIINAGTSDNKQTTEKSKSSTLLTAQTVKSTDINDDTSELTLSSLDEKSSDNQQRFPPKSARDELAIEKNDDDLDNITFEDLTEDGVISCPFFITKPNAEDIVDDDEDNDIDNGNNDNSEESSVNFRDASNDVIDTAAADNNSPTISKNKIKIKSK